MKIFLVIMFTIGGQPAIIEGYLPREQPSQEVCEDRVRFTLDYLVKLRDEMPPLRMVKCVQAETAPEAVRQFAVPAGDLT